MRRSQLPADVAEISNNHIRLFLLSLQERNLSPSTVNTYYRVLHSFFSWLVNEYIYVLFLADCCIIKSDATRKEEGGNKGG